MLIALFCLISHLLHLQSIWHLHSKYLLYFWSSKNSPFVFMICPSQLSLLYCSGEEICRFFLNVSFLILFFLIFSSLRITVQHMPACFLFPAYRSKFASNLYFHVLLIFSFDGETNEWYWVNYNNIAEGLIIKIFYMGNSNVKPHREVSKGTVINEVVTLYVKY